MIVTSRVEAPNSKHPRRGTGEDHSMVIDSDLRVVFLVPKLGIDLSAGHFLEPALRRRRVSACQPAGYLLNSGASNRFQTRPRRLHLRRSPFFAAPSIIIRQVELETTISRRDWKPYAMPA